MLFRSHWFAMRRILSEDEELARVDRVAHKTLFDSIDEVHRRVRFGCKSDILGLVTIKGVGRVRAREMADTLGVYIASDVSSLTERDRGRLADLRGWSPRLVENLVDSARRSERSRASTCSRVVFRSCYADWARASACRGCRWRICGGARWRGRGGGVDMGCGVM